MPSKLPAAPESPDIARVKAALMPLIGPVARRGIAQRGVHVLMSEDLLPADAPGSAQHIADELAAARRDGFDVGQIWYRVEGPVRQVMESRPEDAGFDGSKLWFHGTTASRNFRSFKAGAGGVDELGSGIYFTSDASVAQAWAGRMGEGGRIVPVVLRKGEMLDLSEPVDYIALARRIRGRYPDVDVHREAALIRAEKSVTEWSQLEQQVINRAGEEPWKDWLLEGDEDLATHIKASRRRSGGRWTAWLDRAGYLGAFNRNSQVPGQIVVFDPRNIRSPWARFNPARSESPDLLHSVSRAAALDIADGYVFHLTPVGSLLEVLERGIEPRLGARSQAAGEGAPASFHFPSIDALVDGLMGWAADAFDEDERLALLAVRKDLAGVTAVHEVGYEVRATAVVPPEALVLISSNVDAETDLEGEIREVLRSRIAAVPERLEPDDFQEWFRESAVVDGDGRPRVVYHGTTVWERDGRQLGDIREFDRLASVKIVRRRASIDTVGSWFSTNPGDGGALMYSGGTGAVYPVYLCIRNPFVTTFDEMMAQARSLAGLKKDEFVDGPAVEGLRAWLQQQGYDGLRIVHDASRERQSTEFKDQDAWVALEPGQIRFALGVRPETSEQLREALIPRVPASALASVASEDFEVIQREHALAKARAMRGIGEVEDCAIVRHRAGGRWQMILRDASEPGQWRTQQFDANGFSGHATFRCREDAIESAAEAGYGTRDDGALDRLQNTPAFQRGLFVTDLLRLVSTGAISFEEGSRRIALYDAERQILASVGALAAQAFFVPATGAMVMVADRIAPGHETAVFYHEVMHAHGRRTIGAAGWDRLVGRVRSWTHFPLDSTEKAIHDAAHRRASLGSVGRGLGVMEEELLAYAVEEAVLRGIQPSLAAREGSVQEWLADVVATLQGVIFQQCGEAASEMTPQQLVDLAYALAQLEHPEHARTLVEKLGEVDAACSERLLNLRLPFGNKKLFQDWTGGLPIVALGDERIWVGGAPVVVEALHGTMCEFDNFDLSKACADGNLGVGIYASNDLCDVNKNYATYGPDRLARIDALVDEITEEIWDAGEEIPCRAALTEIAERRAGVSNQGLVMPLYIRMNNPCVLGGDHETKLHCVADMDGKPSGTLLDFFAALREAGRVRHLSRFGSLKSLSADLIEGALDTGYVKVSQVLDAVREEIHTVDCESGATSVGELIRSALEAVGFDGVIDTDVHDRFGRMPGTSPSTVHFVAFDPCQVASCLGSTWERSDVSMGLLRSTPSGAEQQDNSWREAWRAA